jgi:murein DD-endopeptidase MepM/ murein hydrolase activator NlpD
VQDQFAFESFVAILKRYGNDVSMIPLAWYYPRAIREPAVMDVVPGLSPNNVWTPREYQAVWMQKFYELLGEGAPPFLPDNDPAQPYIRSIAFPVLGPTWFHDGFGDPRDGGRRWHEGIDLMGVAGQPLRAAADGVVTRIRYENAGTAGVVISITDADGYR